MSFKDIYGIEINFILVLSGELVQGGNLPPKWWSSIAPEDQDNGLRGPERRQRYGCVRLQCLNTEVRSDIAHIQMTIACLSPHRLKREKEIGRHRHPYYFDRIEHRLIRLVEGDARLARLLRELGLLPTEPHTKLVSRALADIGNSAELRPVHRLAFFGRDAIYIRATETTMLKITAADIAEVPLGTDDVILIADDLGDWPSLAELEPHLESLRPQLGTTCTQISPDLPLSKLTTRWADDFLLTAKQQHQFAFTRFLFVFCASRYSTWPILLLTGEGGSGKSTYFELLLSLLLGEPATLQSLPSQERSLVALLTNSSIAALDNVDGAGLNRSDRSSVMI